MGEVIVIEHLTLDGVMQAPGRAEEDRRDGFRHGGWANLHQDPAQQQAMAAYMSSAWSLLAGRTTYEQFAGYWPGQALNPMSVALDRVRKYVASTTLTEPLGWRNSTLLTGDVPGAVRRLKAELPENLVVFGSGVLVRSLLRSSLVDTLVLLIHPVVLRSGRRLFAEAGYGPAPETSAFRTARTETTGSGVIIATYRPA
ncbi:dihydrofolate reductase family protein [Streptomyces sp. NBC_00448]|uniref:dihydrofolate reductase family protein n=1 Tax=Streptomyces sp. NBC_00448 TaxID=2903652 RepID=UPI002E2331CC